MKFTAAVLNKKKNIKILNLQAPPLKIGQVLVKIKYASICYTQVQEIEGSRGQDIFLPHCLGHEATAEVIEIDKKVTKVKQGDKVCLTWVFSRGINAGGSIYLNNKKKVNAGPVNAFSNYAIVSENKLQKLKKNSDLKKSVLLGCAVPTAFNCILLNTKNAKNKKILVLGCGGIGLLTVYAAKLRGFKEISVVDNFKKKTDVAKKLGATNIISIKGLKKFNDKFDYVIECTGNKNILNESIRYAKKFGGKVFVIGNYSHKSKVNIDPWQLLFGKSMLGSWKKKFIYDNHFKSFEKSMKNFNKNIFFGKKVYPLKDINLAIKDFKEGKVIRPLIKM